MGANNQVLAEYFEYIKRRTLKKMYKDYPAQVGLSEDISQEVFLKLYKSGFFDKDDNTGAKSYIESTINSCRDDKLREFGVYRRSTKAEKQQTGNKTVTINNDPIEETYGLEHEELSTEQYLLAKKAYKWIKDCFNAVNESITDINRQNFFNEAFWWDSEYDMPLKELAKQLEYTSSNPTQEFKRLVKKVSACTEEHQIVIKNPKEQIQILQELIENSEVNL